MGGGCRETYRLTRNPRVLLRARTWKYNKRLLIDDNFAWLVCAVLGHRSYNTSTIYEKPEHACSRCHSWLPQLDPKEWHPSSAVIGNLAVGAPSAPPETT